MSRHLPRTVRLLAAGALTLSLAGGGIAYGAAHSSHQDAAAKAAPAIKTFTPTRAGQITNIDVLRQQIRNYYGDPLGTGVSPRNSNYAKQARRVAKKGKHFLKHSKGHQRHHGRHVRKAILLDVDDTALSTWNYEIASNWAYDPTTNATYVDDQLFPAVPGMKKMARWADRHGYAVFYLTGRPTTQEEATLGNLTSDGVGVDAHFPAPHGLRNGEDGLFTKPDVADYPGYLERACADDPDGKCTTIHYKAATRKHIEKQRYDIRGSFGDQFSDLKGGHADRTFKLPNPNYFLP